MSSFQTLLYFQFLLIFKFVIGDHLIDINTKCIVHIGNPNSSLYPPPKCEIRNAGIIECWKTNNVRIIVDELNSGVEIYCHARYPITVNFENIKTYNIPKFKFRRRVENMFDVTSYVYEVTVLLDDSVNAMGNYTFFHSYGPYSISSWIYVFRPDKTISSNILGTGEPPLLIKAENNEIVLPCQIYDPKAIFWPVLYRGTCDGKCVVDFDKHVLVPADNMNVIYDPRIGFIIKSNLETFVGKYFCHDINGHYIKYDVISTNENRVNPYQDPDMTGTSRVTVIIQNVTAKFTCESPNKIYTKYVRWYNGKAEQYAGVLNMTREVNTGSAARYFVTTVEIRTTNLSGLVCYTVSNTSQPTWYHKWIIQTEEPKYVVGRDGQLDCGRLLNKSSIIQYFPCFSQLQCDLLQRTIGVTRQHCGCCQPGRSDERQRTITNTNGLMLCELDNLRFHKFIVKDLDANFYTSKYENNLTSTDVKIQQMDEVVYSNVSSKFRCTSHISLTHGGLQWAFQYRYLVVQVKTEWIRDVNESDSYEINPYRESEIFIPHDEDIVSLICFAPIWNTYYRWQRSSIKLEILGIPTPPIINGAGQSRQASFVVGNSNKILLCEASGLPKPHVEWSRLDKPMDPYILREYVDGGVRLKFPIISRSHEGDYICTASNNVGSTSSKFTLVVEDEEGTLPRSLTVPIVGGLLGGLILLSLIPLIYFRKRLNQAQIEIRRLTPNEVEEFEKGNTELAQNSEDTNEIIKHLPYNRTFEIPFEHITFAPRILGIGQFGIVREGKLSGRIGSVAIKESRSDCDIEYFKAFLTELKVMIYIGQHTNIVELVGAYTGQIAFNVLYIVLEFCEGGSLEKHLRQHKSVKPEMTVNEGLSSRNEIGLELVVNEQDENLGNRDEKISELPLTDLLKWSLEISNGMEYLASKKVFHGDLATRNVLLGSNGIAKISDFGLARQLYNYTNYVRTNKVPLPWRWMAVESLKQMEFSTKSDVWSYGVTIWEIFTLGDTPYPGLQWTTDFKDKLVAGLRLNKPKHASPEIYHLMIDCWNLAHNERPDFTNIKNFFAKLIQDIEYLSLNFDTTVV